MKRIAMVVAVLAACSLSASATVISNWSIGSWVGTWYNAGTPVNGTGWYVSLFSTSATGPSFSPLTDTEVTHAFIQAYGGPGGTSIGMSAVDTGIEINSSLNVYTAIWNDSAKQNATAFLIVDGSTWDVPLATVPPSVVNYNAEDSNPGGATSGEWQAVPEPSTMALVAIGVIVAGMRKIRNG